MPIKKKRGFIAIAVIVFIIIIGFIGVTAAFFFTSSSLSSMYSLRSGQALYLAESGLERAAHTLLTPVLSGSGARSACATLSISDTTTLNPPGVYSLTGSLIAPTSAVLLSGSLSSSATTVTANATIPTGPTGYSSQGQIMIDQEKMNYSSISGAQFLGVIRVMDGTVASSHASGVSIAQFGCNTTSTGSAPNTTDPTLGQRVLTQYIQLEEGWTVGNNSTGPTQWNLWHWNRPTELSWTLDTSPSGSQVTLNDVAIDSNNDVWIGGDNTTVFTYNG